MRTEEQIMNRCEKLHEQYGKLSAPDDLGFQKRFIKGFAVCVIVGVGIGYILVKTYWIIFGR